MSKTFKFMTLLGNGIAFANVLRPTEKLTFTGSSVNLPGTVNGNRVQTIQNKITLVEPVKVLPEGCTDQCAALSATLSASVSFSSPVQNIEELKDLWKKTKEAVDTAIANENILLGFRPAATSTFTLE